MFYENNFLLDELAFRHSQKIVEGLKLKEIIKNKKTNNVVTEKLSQQNK
jgi:hypothetical protein